MNHPAMLNSEKHIFLKTQIEKLMENYKDKFSHDSRDIKDTIFFGVSEVYRDANVSTLLTVKRFSVLMQFGQNQSTRMISSYWLFPLV